jgi:ribosome maturation factor RimP
MVDIETVVRSVEPVVGALGLSLYDVEVSGSGRARVLRVLVDKPGGIDLDGIAAATEAISPALDRPPLDTVLPGPYALEVSSPGLERPLRTPAHFADAVGETISVKTRAGDDRPARRARGVLSGAGESGFDLTLDDGGTEHLDYGDVAQARTVFEWGPQPKRGRTKKTNRSPKASSMNATSQREPVRP